jgi:restriction endonuclease S subunit
MASALSSKPASPRMFFTKRSNLEGRLDPNFYKPEFRELVRSISRSDHAPLKKIARFSSESWDQCSGFTEEFPYIEIGAVNTVSGEIEAVNWIKTSEAPSRAKMVVRNDDIIVSTTRPSRGAISHVITREEMLIASTGFSVIREVSPTVNRKLLYYLLRQPFILTQLEQRSSGGNYPAITQEELGKILIPILSKNAAEEVLQIFNKAYAAKKSKEAEAQALLDSIDDYLLAELGINLPKESPNTLKDRMFIRTASLLVGTRWDAFYFQGHFRVMTDQLKKSGFPVACFSEVVMFLESGARPKGGAFQVENGVFSLGGEHIGNNCEVGIGNPKYIPIEFHAAHERTATEMYDIILVKDGATTGKIGFLEDPFFVGQNINEHVFLIRPNQRVLPAFLVYYLHSRAGQLQVKREITGATVTGLTRSAVSRFLIPVPPIKKQQSIAEQIASMRAQAKQLRDEAATGLEQAKADVEKMILV